MNGCIITLAKNKTLILLSLCFDDPHGDLPIKLQTKASNLEEYVYTFKLIMTLPGFSITTCTLNCMHAPGMRIHRETSLILKSTRTN